MPRVTRLRYVAEAAPHFVEAVAFYEDAWGLKKVEHESGVAYFAAEGSPEQFIFRLRAADEKRLDLISFAVPDMTTVDALAAEVATQGVRFATEPDTLRTPGGGYGFRCFDPDGRVVEISSDVAERPFRRLEEREAIPQKLSHCVLNCPSPPTTMKFYTELLGFKVSDYTPERAYFMRCTPDHHSVAIFGSRTGKAGFNHTAFELRGFDEVMRALGRVRRLGTHVSHAVDRHTVGDNIYAYIYDPNGYVSELTSDMEQIALEGGRDPRVCGPGSEQGQWGTDSAWSQDPRNDVVPERYLEPQFGLGIAPPV